VRTFREDRELDQLPATRSVRLKALDRVKAIVFTETAKNEKLRIHDTTAMLSPNIVHRH